MTMENNMKQSNINQDDIDDLYQKNIERVVLQNGVIINIACSDRDIMFDKNIWAKPIMCPESTLLGINNTHIKLDQIPFDHTTLPSRSIIENGFGEALYFTGNSYQLYRSKNAYLEHWFCEWKPSFNYQIS